ncbi:MAG: MOSC N-terminal beta barrel domain-containing protein, partial [Cyanobacteria bacterium P01_H01_bin.153]
MAPYLARIDLYPVKSLDGLTVKAATVLASGALRHDRAFALVDQAGRFVNGKRFASIHRVRSRFSDDFSQISLWMDSSAPAAFHLRDETTGLEQWFSDYFQRPVTLQHNGELGFPDDTDSPGPTVISTATVQTVADWYGLSLEESRRRFRTNLEIAGVPAFWEDQLFSESGEPVPFQIGAVTFLGINPCQR